MLSQKLQHVLRGVWIWLESISIIVMDLFYRWYEWKVCFLIELMIFIHTLGTSNGNDVRWSKEWIEKCVQHYNTLSRHRWTETNSIQLWRTSSWNAKVRVFDSILTENLKSKKNQIALQYAKEFFQLSIRFSTFLFSLLCKRGKFLKLLWSLLLCFAINVASLLSLCEVSVNCWMRRTEVHPSNEKNPSTPWSDSYVWEKEGK